MNTEQERADLLPCPFCGAGKTEVRENGRPWLGTKWGEPVSVSVRHWCDHVDGQPSRMIERVGRDRAAAIDAWNRRAALQSQDREDAALAEILREAAAIIEAIPPEFAARNIRWPIVDELEGFALMLDHARRIEGEGL